MENKDGIRDQRLGLLVGVESSLNSTQEGGVLSENMMGWSLLRVNCWDRWAYK